MAKTLLQLRNLVRAKLKDWPKQDALNDATGVNTTDTTFTVDDGTKFSDEQYCQIGDECFYTDSISSNDLTVIRGQKGTTAASHSNNDVIYIDPKYLNTEINDAINECHAQVLEKRIYDDFSLFSQSEVVSNFESSETWEGSGAADTSKFRTGKQGLRLTSTGTKVESSRTGTFDLRGLSDDTFDLFLYVDESDNIDTITAKFHTTQDTALYSYSITGLKDGWNDVQMDRDDFTETGSPDWRQIVEIEFEVTASSGTTLNATFDSLRLRTNQEHIYIYDLPSDLVKLLEVFVYGSSHKKAHPFTRYQVNYNAGTSGVHQLQTHVAISGGHKIGLKYVGNFATLSADSSETTLPTRAELLPVYWACYRMVSDNTAQRAEFDRASAEIDSDINPAWLPERTANYWYREFEKQRKLCNMAKSNVFRRRKR